MFAARASLVAAAVLATMLAGTANAQVAMVTSQSAFSALGTITQNTNFDSFGDGYSYVGGLYVDGDLTFSSGANVIVGTNTGYQNVRPVLAYDYWSPLPGSIAGTHDLFGFSFGYLGVQSDITINLTTTAGSYSFMITNPNLADNLQFVGFEAAAGETFTGFNIASAWGQGSAPVVTDVQLGTAVVAVPEPETYALMLGGLGVLGFVARRRKTA